MRHWGIIIGCILCFLVAGAPSSAKTQQTGNLQEESGATLSSDQDEHGKPAITKLEDIVVTATRTNRETMDVPVSTTVVTAEEIEAHKIVNLDEALKYATGVWNKRMRGIADVGASISIRGISGGERNLIMLDNQPINSVVWGGVPWSGINIDQVERIEVVRGPFSALYGVNAMGGVVNIITKKPMQQTMSLEAGYGEDHTTVSRFSWGDRFHDKFSLSFGAERKYTDGYPTFIQTKAASAATPPEGAVMVGTPEATTDVTGGQTRYIIGDTGNNPTTDLNLFFKGAVDFSAGHSLSFHYTHSKQSDDWGRPNSYLIDQNGRKVYSGTVYFGDRSITFREADLVGWIYGGRDNEIVAANYVNEISKRLTLKVDTGVDYQFRYYTIPDVWYPANALISGGPGTYYEYPSTVYNTTVSSEIGILDSLVATLGISYRHDHGEQDVWPLVDWNVEDSKQARTTHIEGNNDYYSIFAQAEWRVLEKINIIPALRYDYWETKGATDIAGITPQDFDTKSDSMVSPKLSIGFRPMESLSFRASTGIGFKPPDIDKLYRVLPAGGPDETPVYPNRDLDPEKVFSWEIGFDQLLWQKKIQLSATYFENQISDSLFQMTDASGTRWYSGAEAEVKGVEASMRVSPSDWISLFGNITLQDSEVTENKADPTLIGNDLPSTPKMMWNTGFEVNYWKAQLVTTVNHVDRTFTRDNNTDAADNVPTGQSDYTVADIDLHLKLTPQVTASLSIDNLFDEENYLYWKAAGRKYLASVRYEF